MLHLPDARESKQFLIGRKQCFKNDFQQALELYVLQIFSAKISKSSPKMNAPLTMFEDKYATISSMVDQQIALILHHNRLNSCPKHLFLLVHSKKLKGRRFLITENFPLRSFSLASVDLIFRYLPKQNSLNAT